MQTKLHAVSVVTLLAAACGPCQTSHRDGGSGGDGGCNGGGPLDGPGDIQTTVGSTLIHSACFQAFPGGPMPGESGVALTLQAIESSSSLGAQSEGVQIIFSSDCSYVAGQTLQLSSHCVGLGLELDGSGLGSVPPAPFLGLASECNPDYAAGMPSLMPGCGQAAVYTETAQGTLPATAQTTGTLVLIQWSTTLGDTVEVNISGTVTGFTQQGGGTTAYSVAYSSVPISGSATAVISSP
jgi:hypothetical protein